MRGSNVKNFKGEMAFLFICLLFLGLGSIGVLGAKIKCGNTKVESFLFAGAEFLVTGNSKVFGVSETGCFIETSEAILLLIGVAVFITIAISVGFYFWHKYKESDEYFIKDLSRRKGIAHHPEVKNFISTKTVVERGKNVRPSIENPTPSDVGVKIGRSAGCAVWVSSEDSVVIMGPPRSGKGFHLIISDIIDSPGAVVTTSTRGDNFAATAKVREKVGPVMLFDPQGLSGVKSNLKWSPFQGCEIPEMADRRADILVSASGLGSSDNNQEWADQAKLVLTYLLHAGALGNKNAHDLGKWGTDSGAAKEAVTILLNHPKAMPGWGLNLQLLLSDDPKSVANLWFGVRGATKSLALPKIAEAMSPTANEVFDPESFLLNKGSLYLVGTKTGGGAVAPFLMALLDSIYGAATEMAFRSEGNRLDPPLSLVLDEIANMAKWSTLAEAMSSGGGIGISTKPVFQSMAQARATWGKEEAQAIFDSAIIKIQLGGAGNVEDLKSISDLTGNRRVTEMSRSWNDMGRSDSEQTRNEEVISVSEIRRIPFGFALVLSRSGRPVFLKMQPWINRADATQIKQSQVWFKQQLEQTRTTELKKLTTKEKTDVEK